jgi:signal transduction histidine kinase
VTRPIEILTRGTEQIARGSFEPIKVTSNDEFAHLTEAFNDMSEKLKGVNERKAEMMQRISHELRTPLQALLSAHFLLTEERLGPINVQQSRILESIRESINKLTNFSNQFLDIAKIEAGMMEYSYEKVDLVALTQPIVEDARLIAVRKEIRVDLTYAPVPPVLVDTEKVSQVVTNLLSNAIKYTPKNGNIIVNVGPSEFGVRIAVQDSGVGISSDDLPRIFEKFYQAKNAGKAGVKGTGLGLALVKALTEGHGGMVSVSSTVGVGTSFIVEFPAVEIERVKKSGWKPRNQAGAVHA